MKFSININIDLESAVETAAETRDNEGEIIHDSQLDAMVEGVGQRTDNPIGFHANIEADDGRYE